MAKVKPEKPVKLYLHMEVQDGKLHMESNLSSNTMIVWAEQLKYDLLSGKIQPQKVEEKKEAESYIG